MGQEIVYCFRCQERIVTADYGKGLAYQLETQSCCSACAVEVVETLPPREKEQLLARIKATQQRKQSKTSDRLKAIKAGSASGSTRKIPIQEAPKFPSALLGGIAAAVVVVLLLIVALTTNTSPPPAPPPVVEKRPVVPDVRPGPNPEEQRRAAAAKAALQKAREFAAATPRDLHGQVRLWKAALTEAAGTGYEAEVKRELDKAEARVGEELADLERRVRELIRKKDYKGARELVAQARPRHPAAVIDGLERQIRDASLAWVSVFDGKSTAFMSSGSVAFWKVENGAIVRINDTDQQAGQSREEFGDGEIRFRVRTGGPLSIFTASVRQQAGACRVIFLRDALVAMGEGEHEVIFTCRGLEVTATLDGKPAKVDVNKEIHPKGRLQFNGKDGEFKVLAIEYRPLP